VVNVAILADAPFEDENAFLEFLGGHELSHSGIAVKIASIGGFLTSRPLGQKPEDDRDWMLDHYQIHLEIGSQLVLPVPDLMGYDLSVQDQYEEWMQIHGNLHSQINAKLGIFT
jgi:hypothetical protein